MTNWSQPTQTMITVAGAKPDERPAISHPMVKRRVIHPDGLDVQGHQYERGALVTLKADDAYLLERTGHLGNAE